MTGLRTSNAAVVAGRGLRWIAWTMLVVGCLLVQSRQPAAAQGQLVLKVATSAHAQSPWGHALARFRQYVETGTQGRIRVRVFHEAILGSDATAVARTRAGSVQAYFGPLEALYPVANALSAVEQPYLFSSEEDARRKLQSATSTCRALLQAAGLQFGGWQARGFRSWLSTTRPVRSEQDLRAGSLGALPHRLDFLRNAGLSPVADAPSVELHETTLTEAVQRGLHVRARHITLTQHAYAAGVFVYSKTWFDGLAAKTQELLANAPEAASDPLTADVAALEARLIEAMKQRGVDVHAPDSAEARSLSQPLRAAQEASLQQLGEAGRALYRQLGEH